MPDDLRTSILLNPAQKMAIHVIAENRKARKEKGTTLSAILVDALWYFLEHVEGKKREQIEALLPPVVPEDKPATKVTQMPTSTKKH